MPGGLNAENINTNTFFEQLLNKLDAEREINSEIYCDEKKIVESSNYNDLLYGVHAANKMSDIISENIFIEFINSQVKLSLESDSLLSDSSKLKNQQPPPPLSSKLKTKQSDNSSTFDCLNDENYLIISAAKANVVQRLSTNRRVARILTFESSLRNSAQRALTSQPEATPQENSLT